MSIKLAAVVAGAILFVSSCIKPDPIPTQGNQFPAPGDVPVAVTVDVSKPGDTDTSQLYGD